jgi:hypothetical protein
MGCLKGFGRIVRASFGGMPSARWKRAKIEKKVPSESVKNCIIAKIEKNRS